MRFPKTFQYIWWTLLLVINVGAIYLRLGTISSVQLQTLDTALLAGLGVLIFLPFFSEITFLGFGAKQHSDPTGEGKQKEEIGKKEKEQVTDNKQASLSDQEDVAPETSTKA